jgi:L-rhamnose isomerase/sugar isomerase
LRKAADARGLAFDAINSNMFQDQPGRKLSYKFGSLSHVDRAVREQAIAHNVECIEIGRKLGLRALTVWVSDGSNFAGQSNMTLALDRYLDSMREV